MAIAFVKSITATSSGTLSFTSSAFAGSTTTGNLIVITIADNGGVQNGITSVTDSKGNTYTKVVTAQGTAAVSMWYAKNITGGSSHTITVTYEDTLVSLASFVAQEFSGCDTTNPLDQQTSAGGFSTAPSSGASPTTTSNDQLIIGSLAYAAANTTVTAGSGYSNVASTSFTDANAAQESKIVSSAGAQTADFTIGAARDWATIIATFKAAGGAVVLEQEGFRFYADDGSESAATALAAQDTNIVRASLSNTRLRALVNATNDPPSTQYQLEFRAVGDTTWTKITT